MTESRRPGISETELLRLILSGRKAREIAEAAGLSPDQVRAWFRSLLKRLRDSGRENPPGTGQETIA